MFQRYAKQHDVAKGNTLYADILNHCVRYKEYVEPNSKCTSAHECTHGINSDLRNAAGGKVNAFYMGNDNYVVIPEPSIRKSAAIPFVPSDLRGMRFSQYIEGQQSWDDSPLYIYDEWVAYTNGSFAAITLKAAGEYDEDSRIVDGPLEFCAYAAAMLMAVGSPESLLVEFSRYQFTRAFDSYFLTLGKFPAFPEQDQLYGTLKNGSSAQKMREFLSSKIGFDIPDGVSKDAFSWYQ